MLCRKKCEISIELCKNNNYFKIYLAVSFIRFVNPTKLSDCFVYHDVSHVCTLLLVVLCVLLLVVLCVRW
jgi:hypothetical protein